MPKYMVLFLLASSALVASQSNGIIPTDVDELEVNRLEYSNAFDEEGWTPDWDKMANILDNDMPWH